MSELLDNLQRVFAGEISTSAVARKKYAHDASIFELMPEAIVAPRGSQDVAALVRFVSAHKHAYPGLGLTPRSAGTDMSGAAIGSSLIVDMTPHFHALHGLEGDTLHAEPGVFLRDIDGYLHAHGRYLGSAPASRAWSTLGGMVANNAGGERSLQHGNTQRAVRRLDVVLADGERHVVQPLTKKQLDKKMEQHDFEGRLYASLYRLIRDNYELIRTARPRSSKNTMGYNLWDVWDSETQVFDLTQLLSGSQGTLGIITDVHLETYRTQPHNGLLVAYVEQAEQLSQIIPLVAAHHPVTFEGFDDVTFELGIRYFSSFRKQLGLKEWTKQQAMLLGQAARFRGRLPSTVLMIEFDGSSPTHIDEQITAMREDLARFKLKTITEHDDRDSALFWEIRRASFSLLRNKIHDAYAAPFIDDLAVQPSFVHTFLPEVRRILQRYRLPATIAGHFGDGNFHIIPLMDLTAPKERAKLEPILRELVPLVLKYGGTLAAEHNDGMIRGPWLPAIFGDDMYALFKQTKEIFDPQYIFNPGKKTDASWRESMSHIRSTNA